MVVHEMFENYNIPEIAGHDAKQVIGLWGILECSKLNYERSNMRIKNKI